LPSPTDYSPAKRVNFRLDAVLGIVVVLVVRVGKFGDDVPLPHLDPLRAIVDLGQYGRDRAKQQSRVSTAGRNACAADWIAGVQSEPLSQHR